MALRTGGWLTLLTVIVISSESVPVPSDTSKWTLLYIPAWLYVGVQLNVLVVVLKPAPCGRFETE